jgi:hypothetical protein
MQAFVPLPHRDAIDRDTTADAKLEPAVSQFEVRMITLKSAPASGLTKPILPVYAPRGSSSRSAMPR